MKKQLPLAAHHRISKGDIYYEVSGNPENATLVLLHGIYEGVSMWDEVVAILSLHFHIVIPELRGHGRSQGASPPRSIKEMAEDVWHILDEEQIGVANVLGFSLGGAVAQWMTRVCPDRVQNLVLVCTYSYKQGSFWEQLTKMFGIPLVRILGVDFFSHLLLPVFKGGPRISDVYEKREKYIFQRQSTENVVALAKCALAFDSRKWLSQIHTRTLIVYGGVDRTMPSWHAKELMHLLPQAEVACQKSAGHSLYVSHKKWLCDTVTGFLGTVPHSQNENR